jgi:hypothetical protein
MKDSLIAQIKMLVKEKGHANLDKDFPNITDEKKEYVITQMQSGAKYMLDIMPLSKNWVIKKNPNYINQWTHDIKLALITASLALIVGYILWRIDNQSKTQQIQQLKEKVEKVSQKLDSLSK